MSDRAATVSDASATIARVDPRIFKRRFQLSSDLLVGRGLEIGGGANPQRLPAGATCAYFDVRDTAQLGDLFGVAMDYPILPMDRIPLEFPNGADFLIAHNVLEHSANPIATLIDWMAYVRDEGLMVLSIPSMQHCPGDAGRLVPPPEHLLDDFLTDDCDDAFESREHIYSFLLGWYEHIHPGTSKAVYTAHCLSEARRSGHDLHWHALDHEAAEFIIEAAALLSARDIDSVRSCRYGDASYPTLGESIFMFRVLHRAQDPNPRLEATRRRIADHAEKLRHDGEGLLARLGGPNKSKE